jgi:hypothetical protein
MQTILPATQVTETLANSALVDEYASKIKCTSFTFMGSEDPRATEGVGTIGRMHSVLAALLAEIEAGGMATPP